MHSTTEKPLISNNTAKPVLYVAIPYALAYPHMKDALLKLQKYLAPIYTQGIFVPVNSLFNVSELVDKNTPINIKMLASVAVPLLAGCSSMLVIRDKGWEYSEVLINEVAYMAAKDAPIEYIDPY